MTFYIKRRDTSPAFRAILKDAAGVAVDITGNLGVRFHLFSKYGVQIVDAAATVNDAAAGDVQYEWQTADTVLAGIFKAEFEVTYSDGTIETFPNNGYEKVYIDEDLV